MNTRRTKKTVNDAVRKRNIRRKRNTGNDAIIPATRSQASKSEGAIITASGKRIPARIDTICLHGDTPAAVAIAADVRRALQDSGVELAKFSGAVL